MDDANDDFEIVEVDLLMTKALQLQRREMNGGCTGMEWFFVLLVRTRHGQLRSKFYT
jgi:hypothetical protein